MKIKENGGEAFHDLMEATRHGGMEALSFEGDEWGPVEVVLCEELLAELELMGHGKPVFVRFPPHALRTMKKAVAQLRKRNLDRIRAKLEGAEAKAEKPAEGGPNADG